MRILIFRIAFVAILAGATMSPALCSSKALSPSQVASAEKAGRIAMQQQMHLHGMRRRQVAPDEFMYLPAPSYSKSMSSQPISSSQLISSCVQAAMAQKLDDKRATSFCTSQAKAMMSQ